MSGKRELSRRGFLHLSALGIVGGILAACGPKASPTPTSTAKASEEPTQAQPTPVQAPPTATTVPPAQPATLQVWYNSPRPQYLDLLEEMGRKFGEAHPGVTVELSPVQYEDFNKSWKPAIDSGTGPDVAHVNQGERFAGYAGRTGHLVDFAPIISARGWDKRIDMGLVKAYNPYDGKIWALPYEVIAMGVYYNKGLFADLGLTAPQTWEELDKIITTLKANGHTPFATSLLDGWPFTHYFMALTYATTPHETMQQLTFLDPDVSFTNEGFVQAMRILNDWVDKGYFNESFEAIQNEDAVDLFATGQTAMFLAGTWNTSVILEGADFEPGFFLLPRFNPDLEYHAMITPNNLWLLSQDSKHQEVGIDYIDMMLGEEMAKGMWDLGALPMYKFAEIPPATSSLQRDIYVATQSAGGGFYYDVNMQPVLRVMYDAFALMVAGKLTPEEALAKMQEAYEQFLAGSQG